jgi:hypothetical protein
VGLERRKGWEVPGLDREGVEEGEEQHLFGSRFL